VPYLDLAVAVTGGWLMGKAALAAANYLEKGEGDLPFYKAKIASAAFYADQMLPLARARASTVITGDAAIAGLAGDDLFQ
jgi:acyl-CoA dehydrogenase